MLYDARSETDPFAGVSYWARALDDATRGFPITKFLVASRIDRGGTAASERQLGEIAARHGFARCFETSARRGDGVERLAERREMRRLVDAILSARTREGRGARGR